MAKKSSKTTVSSTSQETPTFGLSLGDVLRKAVASTSSIPNAPLSPSSSEASASTTKTPILSPAPSASKQAQPPPLKLCRSIVVRHERKGHGGKTVTTVSGIDASPDSLSALAQVMRKALGCGARAEEGMIVLQGDLVERVRSWLETEGAPNVILGTRPSRPNKP
jgi:translation initiation factor 1